MEKIGLVTINPDLRQNVSLKDGLYLLWGVALAVSITW